jgi:hypothetical protein
MQAAEVNRFSLVVVVVVMVVVVVVVVKGGGMGPEVWPIWPTFKMIL